jgi:antirestriction protein ArdC
VLRTDKRAILVAAALAQKAADYVLTRSDPTRAEALAA